MPLVLQEHHPPAAMMTYDDKVLEAFKAASDRNKGKGASAHEVTQEMLRRGTLAELDTVIDIADILKRLLR